MIFCEWQDDKRPHLMTWDCMVKMVDELVIGLIAKKNQAVLANWLWIFPWDPVVC